ncbi:ABC transporter ATP-binding protein [Leucobacter sp. W1153]|uniref:ABC transporter ATP-binding protein n=1 Tax=Leucobacter sp. W1153 TaxID=3439064 RepID=UPI003F368F53
MADTAAEPRSNGTSITFTGVTKTYGSNAVLHRIDLDVQQGEFIALLGPSGCGKTTLLRCLAGLETVTSGEITVNGADIARVPANKRDMGVVFQAYSLFPHMSVRQNVEFGLRMRKVAGPQRTARVEESLELVGLAHLGDRYAHTLSGGQQQRVALARALVTRPRALLLDEPLSALDAKVRVRLRDEIKAIQTELGITTIFVTHDQEEALAVADRVAVMKDGVIEQLGAPEELYRRPATSFVAQFIGESNRVPGTLLGDRVNIFDTQLPVIGAVGLREGSAVHAFVRPEQFLLSRLTDQARPEDRDARPGAGTRAVVVSSGFLGAQRRTVVRLQDGELLAVQHSASECFSVDELVGLRLAGDPVAVERA